MLAWLKLKRLFHLGGKPSASAGERGAAGERLAAEFFRGRQGYEIVARNWRNPRDQREEIDLVDLRVWSQTPSGAIRVLQESLTGGSRAPEALAAADAVIDGMAFGDCVEAALRVTGWTPPPPDKKPESPPDPAAK